MNDFVSLSIRGEELRLLPGKAVWQPARSTLFIADTHFGKEATFRANGVPIGDDSLRADLARLSSLVRETAVQRLVILGDLLHSRSGRNAGTLDLVTRWRQGHADLAIELVKGNHDRAAGQPLVDWNICIVPDGAVDGPFVFSHFPDDSPQGYVLAGHLHPKVRLREHGAATEKLPCFWFRPGHAVLPAFGSFIDSAVIAPQSGDRVFAIAGDTVHEVSARANDGRRRRSLS